MIRALTCLFACLFLLSFHLQAKPLRGFGEVEISQTGDRTVFRCESPEKATLLLHKLGRDLSQSATETASWQTVQLGGVAVNVLSRPGIGSFLPTASGTTVTVYTATTDAEPAKAFAGVAGELKGARFFDASFRYPAYLDKYSHYGIGSWYPSNWGDDISKGHPNDVDDHFAFAKEMDLVLQPNAADYLLRNLLPKLHEYDRPYHFIRWQEWSPELAIMAPEELITTGPQFSAMPHYYGQISDGGYRLEQWRNWKQQQLMNQYKDDALLVDWPDPNGEVGPFNESYYWDFTENNRLNFVKYLRDVRGYTLATLGEAWHGDAKAFANWDAVPIPMSYDFFGWSPISIQANRSWRVHPANGGKALEEGIAAGWQKDDADTSTWSELPAPGGELISIFWRARKAIWYRGTIDVPADWLATQKAKGPIYLNALTFTTSRGTKRPDRVWLNGKELGAFTHLPGSDNSGQSEVTDLLRAGPNTIAYLPADVSFHGSFFLTDKVAEDFPFADPQMNAQYVDWNEYVPWCIADRLEKTYQAIRAVDPNRFIKMHAFRRKDLGVPLAARFGAAGHNTGDEAFFRPWDRRFGYVRGNPGSCEPSGSVNTPEHFKRWLGWHSFTGGPNALDYFHNIQSMMYSPVKDLWREYMPYWKLAPRRDLKKPDLAIMWSSRNNSLMPKSYPYAFDLGRGDLQGLGFSYVYVDESTFRDGLVDDYPVVWDAGTQLMQPETVAQIKAYVEAGGTYIAIQATGIHTDTQKESWPIQELSGFEVGPERPMDGVVAIMAEQTLLPHLAGKSFYNRGRSIDYSDYNYADRCYALKPIAEGTEAIARYQDGGIAIGMRTLGKGKVIVLASPFWRDSYDKAGMWWPSEAQSDFMEDLLGSLGVKPVATADTRKVWREHYLATNGTEEYLFLHNPYDETVTFSTTWQANNLVGKLYDPKNGAAIPAEVAADGRTVTIPNLTLTARETLIVATQPKRAGNAVMGDWFAELSKFWRQVEGGTVLPRPDLPLYELRLADDLYAKVATQAEVEALPAIPAGTELRACQSPEAFEDNPDTTRHCIFHTRFATPAEWLEGDRVIVFLRGMSHAVGDINGPVSAWFNGVKLLDQESIKAVGYSKLQKGAALDVSKLLRRDGENELVFVTGQNGFEGEVDVQMRPAAEATLEISGSWDLQVDADSGVSKVQLPGSFEGLTAATTFDVPADWQGSRIFAELEVEGSYDSFAINEKVIFHPVHWNPGVTYMDITPWVLPGKANRLTLITSAATTYWEPGKLEVKKITLQRVTPRKH